MSRNVDKAVADIIDASVQTRPVEQVAERVRRPEFGVVATAYNATPTELIDLVVNLDIELIQ